MIDRKALITRHNPVLRADRPADPAAFAALSASPLSVGNGEFAFTADFTGLQTLVAEYRLVPLCTLSQWGWHSFPDTPDGAGLRLKPYDTYGRAVGYASDPGGQRELFDALRENPHRLHLGALGFAFRENGRAASPADYRDAEQTLDLWDGLLGSVFKVFGRTVQVETFADPATDAVAARIRLDDGWELSDGEAALCLSFPYGSPAKSAADWKAEDRHRTDLLSEGDGEIRIRRVLDDDAYGVVVRFAGLSPRRTGTHRFEFALAAREAWITCAFTRDGDIKAGTARDGYDAARARNTAWWNAFWSRGGALRLRDSADPRAAELERRVTLSQYLTAIQCAGSIPPAETGLTCNSWYGKFHLEMHPWHAAHFPVWGRPDLLERSMDWYLRILPAARSIAASQGYAGARWPKMTDPSGRNAPSAIAVLLAWQQPHPILLAELLYQASPTRETLEKYAPLVEETAVFISSFLHLDSRSGRYVAGPPLIPVQETHPPEDVLNPPFELAYFRWALQTADVWRNRLRRPAGSPDFPEIARGIAQLPEHDGAYIAHERCPDTFTRAPFNHDHPAMLGAMGFVPGEHAEVRTMRRTLERVLASWDRESMWGWDFPMMAMTCVRLGLPSLAVDVLMMETSKNRYLPNGHNPQSSREDLPLYLPGNGGLLLAVAMMTAGCNLVYGKCDWRPDSCVLPGFPDDGSWAVEAEGLRPYL
ncbi:MAG: glycoside hydrolase family 65 [Clostridia bacterium]|nr:glycoside hydrolase family 65 [Clostridia bacterium]